MHHELTPLCLQVSHTKYHVAPPSYSVFYPLFTWHSIRDVYFYGYKPPLFPQRTANWFTLIQVPLLSLQQPEIVQRNLVQSI